MTKREEIDGLVAFLQGVPLDERRIYMERACSAEPRLRPILQALLNGRSVDEEAVGELSIPSPSELTRSRRGPQWGVRRAPAPTVSHFDLLDELGSGGMGVVYRARDQRLDRYVALKFLPDYLNADDAARERFVNEARAASALDHPNICTVHEIGETEAGRIYIAMAYYDGATLTQSMASGALAVEDAVRYAVQIASGLQAAHDAGIVHRDVKPANVMITDRDQVKILDFGLAKIQDVQLTRSRVAMGTIAYMSPEQTRGEAVDHRTDIWSLGVVLYQMLTGRPPFDAGYQQAVMYQILHEEPETIRSIRDDVSEALEWLVWKMLRKEPGDRYQSISEVLVDLRHANSRGGEGAPTVAPRAHWSTPRLPGPTPVKLRVRALVAAVVALPLVLLSLHLAGNGEKATASVARLALPLPADQFLAVAGSTSYPFDVSPDGTMLVYLGWSRGVTQLFLRRLDEFGPRPLAGTEGARQPFFSPDGAWVGFFAGGQLRKAAVEGGAPMVVGPAHGSPFGAHWGPQGTILFSTVEHGLFRVSAEGGTPDLIAPAFAERPSSASDYEDGPPAPAHRPRWPRFLPDGGHALVSTDAGLHVLSLATGELHYLFAGSQARYVPTGHLLFAEGDNQVRLVPFDPNRRRVTGPPRPALDNVFRGPGSGALAFAVSETGTLVYLTDGLDRSLVYVDRAGQEVPISVRPRGIQVSSRLP